nr:hypothetical protein [uncultured Desulfobacter sp.]
MIKAIIFDYDGTLVDFVDTDICCLKAVHKACAATCSTKEFTNIAVQEITRFQTLVDERKENPLDMHLFRLKNTLSRCNIQWDSKFLNLYLSTLFEYRINLMRE